MIFIERDENDDQWVVDDTVPFGEADWKYLGIRLFGDVGMTFNGQPRGRISLSSESIAWVIAGNLADAYRPEGL